MSTQETTVDLPLPVTVGLIGEDGNAFTILGAVGREMKRAGFGHLVDQFTQEATSGDYDHLLATVLKYVEVE